MEEKPFAPSERKLRTARQRGEVPYSRFLTTAVSTCATAIALGVLAPSLFHQLKCLLSQALMGEPMTWMPLGWSVLGILLVAFFSALGGAFLQVGWLFSWQTLKPRWRGSSFSWVDGVFVCLKWLVIGGALACFFVFLQSFSLDTLWGRLYRLALVTSGLLLCLALLDWYYRIWQFRQQQRMTAREKQEEQRESEGSELTTQRRDRLQERE